jgi:hypothetical protein
MTKHLPQIRQIRGVIVNADKHQSAVIVGEQLGALRLVGAAGSAAAAEARAKLRIGRFPRYDADGRKVAEYRVWRGMHERCYRPETKGFSHYGGRGIGVHPDWCGPVGFDAFIAELGARPGADYTLDRVDNEADYGPGNCRWVTWTVNNNHRRSSRMITLDGETMSAADWARRAGLRLRQTVTNRLGKGWHERAAVFGLEGEGCRAAHDRLGVMPVVGSEAERAVASAAPPPRRTRGPGKRGAQ